MKNEQQTQSAPVTPRNGNEEQARQLPRSLRWLCLLGIATMMGSTACNAGLDDFEPPAQPLGEETSALSTADHGFVAISAAGVIDPIRQYNSAGGAITLDHYSAGTFHVRFAGLGGPGDHIHLGNVHVSALGNDATRCYAHTYGKAGSDLIVHIKCRAPNYTLTSSGVIVQFNRPTAAATGHGAHAYTSQPTRAYLDVRAEHTWNSMGAVNSISRSSIGHYQLKLRSLAELGGNVQVSSYGNYAKTHPFCMVTPNGTAPIGECNAGGNDQHFAVYCFDSSGAPIDSYFHLSFLKSTFVNSAHLDGAGAYVWSDSADAGAPLPADYSFNSETACNPGAVNSVTKMAGIGSYEVHHPLLNADDGVPHVTATTGDQGAGKYCKVAGWAADGAGTGVVVQVQCFAAGGAAADSAFVETFMSSGVSSC